MKTEKTAEEIRKDARDRKRAQRQREALAKEESRLRTMDPGERNVERIMAQIALEPRRPQQPRTPPAPPQPARLPTLREWVNYLKQIKTEAVREEISRIEAAISSGMVNFPTVTEQVNHATL